MELPGYFLKPHLKDKAMKYSVYYTTQSGIGKKLFTGTYAECREFQAVRAAEMRAAKHGPVSLKITKWNF